MKKTNVKISGADFPLYSLNTLIVGSGAASLNAAVNLVRNGQQDIAIVTDRWGGGTSNNTGSDKQTYYKLSQAGSHSDSAREMAGDLFRSGSMHGDIALCEAQNSLQAFYHLVELDVPFPHDQYGAYIGYKTDHDPRQRATSAGPFTSQMMFSALAKKVKNKRIKIFDRHEIITLLTTGTGKSKKVVGAIALDLENLSNDRLGFVLFNAVNVVLGTGGPAGIYKTSVYPESQIGSTGIAFEIGAVGHNLTESQYGIASIKFRWNLSGSYQQVIPRYISTDQQGGDEQEFLNPYFPSMGKLASAIFLKGYQWPFDPRKVENYGSSLIDILVYQETVLKNRRVFLDFQRNPGGGEMLDDFSLDKLTDEAQNYLKNSHALQTTPIERLAHMNPPAIEVFKNNGIDLSAEYLEIAVCAQHNNGGLKGNIWWESNIKHLFPVGEVNGSHGVYRPGGSALNAGQVGSLRAAKFIAAHYNQEPLDSELFLKLVLEQVKKKFEFSQNLIDKDFTDKETLINFREQIQQRTSACGAHIRNLKQIETESKKAWQLYNKMKDDMKIASVEKLPFALKNIDLCLTHALYLEAIREYLTKGGKSRGSFWVRDPSELEPNPKLGDTWRFALNPANSFVDQHILEIRLDEKMQVEKKWVKIRPIPKQDEWFETVWNQFRKNEIIK